MASGGAAVKEITKRRLGLLAQGYRIIPTHGKAARLKGWPTQEFVDRELNEKRVISWERRYPDLQSIGVRLDLGLGSIDADADNPELSEAAWQAIEAKAPLIAAGAPVRYGKGPDKFALFVRVEGAPFKYAVSRYYLRPEVLAAWQAAVAAAGSEKVPDPETHKIEIFGGAAGRNGNCVRHFGIVGPHSYADDGSVAAEYRWGEGPTLEDTPLAGLPVLTEELATDIINDFDARAVALGWVPLSEAMTGGNSQVAYDITEATRFDTDKGGEQIDYAELCADFGLYGSLRCSANFIPGRGAGGGRDHCVVGDKNRHGCVAVHVYGDDCTHFPAELAPRPDLIHEEIERLREELEPGLAAPPRDQTRPTDSMSVARKVIWLVDNYGYNALNDAVVELSKPDDDCQLRPQAFARLYRAWREEVTGPRGGRSWAYATGGWEVDAKRVDIEGVRMRPDMPFPVYAEAGRVFKNTYLRPAHTGAGDIQPWLAFMEHLLPVAEERAWFCDWLSHKHLHPGVPGVAVIMVAAGPEGPVYGTGRGMLRDIIARLLGPKYVRPIDFDVFTGKSAQGTYTDWAAYSVLVTINEARDTGDSGRWTERRAVYERLKEIVDPRAIERTFLVKHKQAFRAQAFASYLIASNNRDALQIPADDRRAAALVNGEQMRPEMAAALQEWMDVPGNIAELARWLEARDLSTFDAYLPPVTETKTVMQELGRSELDDAFNAVRRKIGPKRLFTGEQIKTAVLVEMGEYTAGEELTRWVRRKVREAATRVGHQTARPQRHHILGWRGQDTSWADGAAAQLAVSQTYKVLGMDDVSSDGEVLDLVPPTVE